MIGLYHMCQQCCSEDPACGLPQPPAAQPPLQLGVSAAQAEACQHTHCSITLEPETLNLQEAGMFKCFLQLFCSVYSWSPSS